MLRYRLVTALATARSRIIADVCDQIASVLFATHIGVSKMAGHDL